MTYIFFVAITLPSFPSQFWRVDSTPLIFYNVQHIFMGSQPSTRRCKGGRNRLSYMKVLDYDEKRNPARGSMRRKTLKVFRFAFHFHTKEERKKQRSKRSCVRYSASMLHDEQKSMLYRNQDNPVSTFSFFSSWLPNNQFEQLYRSHRYYFQHGTIKGLLLQHFSNVTPTYRSIARYNSVALERNQPGITTISSHRERRPVAPMPPVLQALPLTRFYHLKPKISTLESQKLPACQSKTNCSSWPPFRIARSSLPVSSSQGRHRDHRLSITNITGVKVVWRIATTEGSRGHQKQESYLSLLRRLPPRGFTKPNEDIYVSRGTSGWEWLLRCLLVTNSNLNVHLYF